MDARAARGVAAVSRTTVPDLSGVERAMLKDRARLLYEASEPMEAICRVVGRSPATIGLWQRADGGWDRRARREGMLRHRWPWLDEACRRWENGESLRTLTREFLVAEGSLSGIALRERWDAEMHNRHACGSSRQRGVASREHRCLECGEVKPLDQFARRGRGGLHHPRCHPCRRQYRGSRLGEYEARNLQRRLALWRNEGRIILSAQARRVRARFRAHLLRIEKALRRTSVDGQCVRCGHVFRATGNRQRYCSKVCRWREMRFRRRARKRGAFVEPVDWLDIYQRDGGRCQLCGGRVDRRCRYPHHQTPVLDHIVPLSRGGRHERKNVQLAHNGCNNRKRVAAVGEQLRCFG